MTTEHEHKRPEVQPLTPEASADLHAKEVRRGQDMWKTGGELSSQERPKEGAEPLERGRAPDARSAWAQPGTFHIEKDTHGMTTRISGWLSLREGPRPSAENALQNEARSKHAMGRGVDSGHILGYALGGPAAGYCADQVAAANQIPMDARINRSQIAGVEGHIRGLLSQGKTIYAEATVRYATDPAGKSRPLAVEYAFYERAADGSKRPLQTIPSAVTRIDTRPSESTGQAVKKAGLGKAADFYSDRPAGAHGVDWPEGH